MTKPERSWEVSSHEPIQQLDDNLWVVTTTLPLKRKGTRRMVIARRRDGGLVFYNAAPLDEPAMKQLEGMGKPAFLVLPYHLHMMDGHAFAQRLNLKIYGPKSDSKMAARVKVEGGFEDFPADPQVQVAGAAGAKNGEAVMAVRSADGKRLSLVFADLLMNIPSEGASLVSKVIGFAGGPRVPWLIKAMFLKSPLAFKAQLETWAADPALTRLIPSHGEIIDLQAAQTLRRLSDGL